MTKGTPATPATLRVEKSDALPFQEVTVLDNEFLIQNKKTLTDTDTFLEFSLAPGSYIVSGLSPSGSQTKIPVTLAEGEQRTVIADTDEGSPHEWLADISSRQQLPGSIANVTRSAIEQLGSHTLQSIRAVSPAGSLSLPASVVGYAASGLVGVAVDVLSRRLELTGRPQSSTRRPDDISLRTYCWSTRNNRWMRSDLIELAHGEYALDYTRLNFPPRNETGGDLEEKIHLIGAFQRGHPAKFIALPLFTDGAQLVLSHGSVRDSDQSEPRSEDHDGPTAEEAGSETRRTDKRTQDLSWRLSAANGHVDALLQALNGRGFRDRDAISETAISFAEEALQEKRKDPEAAVVAGFFLLQYRRLDIRARWVENLARWFPWSPDALTLGAWGNILFETGDSQKVLQKLARIYSAGPPQFLPARKLLRDLISIRMDAQDDGSLSGETKELLEKLWQRIGREMQREIPGGPFYSFERSYHSGSRDHERQEERSVPAQ